MESALEVANRLLEAAQETHKIEIECTDEAAASILGLLKEFRIMGSQGSSRNIVIKDWDGKTNFGFDGDGASKIFKIVADGEVVED